MTNREALKVITRLRKSLDAQKVQESTPKEWRLEIGLAYDKAADALKRAIRLDNARKEFERRLDDYNHR